jgi:hypothetical protein
MVYKEPLLLKLRILKFSESMYFILTKKKLTLLTNQDALSKDEQYINT